jgi:hypothetical protein
LLADSIRPDLIDHGGAVDVSYCDAERARALMTSAGSTSVRR